MSVPNRNSLDQISIKGFLYGFLGVFIVLSLRTLSLHAQEDSLHLSSSPTARKEIPFSLFGSDSLLRVSIRFDLTDYIKKNEEGTTQTGEMTIYRSPSDSILLLVGISTRGYFRKHYCTLAPMEISFRRIIKAYPGKGSINNVKLVSGCNFSSRDEQFVLKEYLVYKMYNTITDSSFRVRLARITYIDTRKNRKPITMYGFFIEPKSVLALRVNSVVVRNMNLTQNDIDFLTMDKVAIFNYMVGGWDWAVQSLHNIVILKSLKYSAGNLGIAVPFDFDLTGVVNPDYNRPPSETGLKSNQDRKYMGICRDQKQFRSDLLWFRTKKNEIYKTVGDFQYLAIYSRREVTAYLDSFFDLLDRPRSLENLIYLFTTTCLNL